MTEYYNSQENAEEYIRLAKDISGAEIIRVFSEFLPDSSSLLELGSGPGADWHILSQTFEVTGSDLSPAFIKHLRNAHPQGNFQQLDAVKIQTSETFDGIYSNKVLHHLTDSELAQSIERQVDILNSTGLVCHSFWLGEGDEVFKGMFVNYHSEDELYNLFSKHFDVLKTQKYKEFEEDDSVFVIAQKK